MIVSSINYDDKEFFDIEIESQKYILNYEQLENLKLRENDEISFDVFRKIEGYSEYNKAINMAFKYASSRFISSHQLKNYLYRKNIDSDNIDKILEEFVKLNLIDDDEYLKSYISDKIQFSKSSKKKIKFDLIKIGFPQNKIEEYLNDLDTEAEIENAYEITIKKFRDIDISDLKLKNKIYQFLYRKGFEYDTINTVLLRIGF
ncbi:MAG: RecX family transcriptional regulator [Tissierellia bacterium]|nr:RecX family transcriptional regulator [Tissierellia bacterium]